MLRRIAILVLAFVILSAESCVGSAAKDILDDGVARLGVLGADATAVLTDTRERLIDAGQSTLANEVDTLIRHAEQGVTMQAFCGLDFVRNRAHRELIGLRATITHETINLTPTFCEPVPSAVDLNIEAARRTLIAINGFDLSKTGVKVLIESPGGARTDVSDVLDNPTDYLLTVNLATLVSDPVRRPILEKGQRLVFVLGTASPVEHTVAITPVVTPTYRLARLHIAGQMDLTDDETWPMADEHGSFPVDAWVWVPANGTNWSLEKCTGDEVTGTLDLTIGLARDTGNIAVSGSATYREGTGCGRGQEIQKGPRPMELTAARTGELQTRSYTEAMSDGQGSVSIRLTFSNVGAWTTADALPPAYLLHR
jgi:hypothetical protein